MNYEEAKAKFENDLSVRIRDLRVDNRKDLRKIAKLAYQDMTPRTIKGHNKAIQDAAIESFLDSFEKFLRKDPKSQKEFDEAHEELCDEFCKSYNLILKEHIPSFSKQEFGKAQKITNMFIKYYSLLPDVRSKQGGWILYAHMPLDSYTLNWYKENAFRPINSPSTPMNKLVWSKLNRNDYRCIQEEIREALKSSEMYPESPLEAEFIIWEEEKIKAVEADLTRCVRSLLKNQVNKENITGMVNKVLNSEVCTG